MNICRLGNSERNKNKQTNREGCGGHSGTEGNSNKENVLCDRRTFRSTFIITVHSLTYPGLSEVGPKVTQTAFRS